MVVVVSVSPVIEREVYIDADHFSDKFIHADGGKVREMSHVVELNEEADHVKDM
jgi:hypothetical protein